MIKTTYFNEGNKIKLGLMSIINQNTKKNNKNQNNLIQ